MLTAHPFVFLALLRAGREIKGRHVKSNLNFPGVVVKAVYRGNALSFKYFLLDRITIKDELFTMFTSSVPSPDLTALTLTSVLLPQ